MWEWDRKSKGGWMQELKDVSKIYIIADKYRQIIISYPSMLGFYSNHTRKQTLSTHTGNTQPSNCPNGYKKIKDYSYNPTDRIGKGFSSIVYKGTNDITNETVAIKAIDMKGVKDTISREMLECEIEALKTIKHDNVLKCFDVVRESSHCYIITEFCNQGDLSGLVKKKRRLTEEETMKLLKDIVSGFVEIGQKGFLHRDLKLANVFISEDKAKIADFGFAKKIKFSSEKEKYNVGSPLYMSPQALKKNIYSLKNDIWSIGIIAYQMLHGETPWECKTEKQLIDKMTRIPVRFRDTLKISEPLKQFIKKCLEVDERMRMSLEDLKVWIGGVGSTHQRTESYHNENNVLGPTKMENLPKLNLTQKPVSNVEKLTSQTEITQRLTSRSQRQLNSNKENMGGRSSGLVPVPKSMIQRNNAIVVNEINTFRLIYKLMEKMTKLWSFESQMTNILGTEVLKKVTALKECFDVGSNQYGLGMIEGYLNERTNAGIKKYKSVVMEYFKKYTNEIKIEKSSYSCLKTEIKKLLKKKVGQLKDEEELLMGYWMVELVGVTRETSKEKLDSIIEPKIKLTRTYIDQRIKELDS